MLFLNVNLLKGKASKSSFEITNPLIFLKQKVSEITKFNSWSIFKIFLKFLSIIKILHCFKKSFEITDNELMISLIS